MGKILFNSHNIGTIHTLHMKKCSHKKDYGKQHVLGHTATM